MIVDGAGYGDAAQHNRTLRAIEPFISFLQRKLGVSVLYNRDKLPFGRSDLVELVRLADSLQKKGIIKSYGRGTVYHDEPRLHLWHTLVNVPRENWSGGTSVERDDDALTAALAEAIERYIWFVETDYFRRPQRATIAEIAQKGPYIAPEQFTTFSETQRTKQSSLELAPDDSYLWIQGQSVVTNKPIYIPAQTVSAAINPQAAPAREPLIRAQQTIGLATWKFPAGAQLAGMLEIIEREAYMIMWLNQLSLPRVSLSSLRGQNRSLDTLMDACSRYRLSINVVRMVTDAPTHAICVIVEDTSGNAPRFSFGLKSHRSLAHASERALHEALRSRRFIRKFENEDMPSFPTVENVGHFDRLWYWSQPNHTTHLEFLVAGKEESTVDTPWEHDTVEEHRARIIEWSRAKNYECVAIDMSASRSNPTSWSIYMMVMPNLHPTHLFEKYIHLGGARLQDVPKQFGYTPRKTPFTEMPHPYA